MPQLFSLRDDKVANIRLCLARFLAETLLQNGKFKQQKPQSNKSVTLPLFFFKIISRWTRMFMKIKFNRLLSIFLVISTVT
jgi:hypothetical protein